VFRPTILTLLGVMMYLRLGWVVGDAGLLGALSIIALVFGITIATALSLSSITTNIRLGAGGVFTLISQSLGLETGGAIGLPLYLAQALSAGLYLYGFTETWTGLFPEHPAWLVLTAVFAFVFAASSISHRVAFRLQGLVLFVVLASLGAVVLGLPIFDTGSIEAFHAPQWWGTFPSGDYWYVFAVFFPAGTGVMVGAGMSGNLKNPRRSIPRGTMFAVTLALLVYVLFAFWYGVMATPEELRQNYLIVVERSAYAPLVYAGILASTFTAALSSMVAAPRVLNALGKHDVVPGAEFFGRQSSRGEPLNASLVTGGIVGAALLLGSLDRVAVLITMFFLITYLIVNVVVLIEQSLGMVSFRPRLKIPLAVPVIGTVGSSMAVLIVSPAFALVAIGVVIAIYVWLLNRDLETPWETVRSSIWVSLVDWASRHVAASPDEQAERSWKPDVLVPVTTRAQADGNFRFLRSMTYPKGSLQVVGVVEGAPSRDAHLNELEEVAHDFRMEGLYATATVLDADDLVHGVRQTSAVLRGSRFRPNVLYALVEQHDEARLQGLLDASNDYEMGAAFLELHSEAGFGHEREINVWVRDQSPEWYLGLRLANLDLAILFAFQIARNWGARIRLLTVVADEDESENAELYLRQLIEDARLPRSTRTWVQSGSFDEALEEAPHADLQIVGMSPTIDKERAQALSRQTGSSVLFVRDSGKESALA
jgi:amino acid transporter